MPGKTLLAFAPDGNESETIVAVASVFSVRGFTHIALISPSKEQLSKDEDKVLDAIQERGYSCQTRTITSELDDVEVVRKILKEVEGWGELECVFWDATTTDIESSQEVVLALAQETVPLLQKSAGKDERTPSFIVAGKSLSLADDMPGEAGDGVHVALVKTDQPQPEKVGDAVWELYKQPKSQWRRESQL